VRVKRAVAFRALLRNFEGGLRKNEVRDETGDPTNPGAPDDESCLQACKPLRSSGCQVRRSISRRRLPPPKTTPAGCWRRKDGGGAGATARRTVGGKGFLRGDEISNDFPPGVSAAGRARGRRGARGRRAGAGAGRAAAAEPGRKRREPAPSCAGRADYRRLDVPRESEPDRGAAIRAGARARLTLYPAAVARVAGGDSGCLRAQVWRVVRRKGREGQVQHRAVSGLRRPPRPDAPRMDPAGTGAEH
jgi:hypothetical protein